MQLASAPQASASKTNLRQCFKAVENMGGAINCDMHCPVSTAERPDSCWPCARPGLTLPSHLDCGINPATFLRASDMPTYEYECETCGHQFEVVQSMKDPRLTKCPKEGCPGPVHRKIGRGAGIIFKGSGFYQTDYRSDAYKEAAKKDSQTSAAPAPAASAPAPSAPASGSNSGSSSNSGSGAGSSSGSGSGSGSASGSGSGSGSSSSKTA